MDDGYHDDPPPRRACRYADRVEVIREENSGLVKAVNADLGAVRREYVGLLDADDIWPLDRCAGMFKLLRRQSPHHLVHGDIEVIDADSATLHPYLSSP